jgi:hypothetical protein
MQEQEVRDILNQIGAIRYGDNEMLPSLSKCQENAARISRHLHEGRQLSRIDLKLVEDFRDLIKLVASTDLDDGDWSRAIERVRESFEISILRAVMDKKFSILPTFFADSILSNNAKNISKEPSEVSDTSTTNSQEIARSILQSADLTEALALQHLNCHLLIEGKWGLAFHLSRCIESQTQIPRDHIPSWLIQFLALSPEIINDLGAGGIVDTLANDIDKFKYYPTGQDENQSWHTAMNLLQMSIMLRPMLLAPNAMVNCTDRFQGRVDSKFESLFAFFQRIAQHARHLRPLSFEKLGSANQDANWRGDIKELQRKANHWLTKEAPGKKINYAPATYVWLHWLQNGGIVDDLLQPIINYDVNEQTCDEEEIQLLRSKIKQLSNDAEIKTRIDHTDRILHQRKGRAIRQNAFRQIRLHLNEAIGFVKQWLQLQELQPSDQNDFVKQQIGELRSFLFDRKDNVITELNALEEKGLSSPLLNFSISFCQEAIQDTISLFRHEDETSKSEPEKKYILNIDLLKIPMIHLNDQWEPTNLDLYNDVTTLQNIVELVDEPIPNWVTIFDNNDEFGNHDTTSKILEYLSITPDTSSANIEMLKSKRVDRINLWRERLDKAISITRVSIENAFGLDLLRTNERTQNIVSVENIENCIKEIIDFSDAFDELNNIQSSLNFKKEQKIQEIKSRFARLGLRSDSEDYERVSNALKNHDIFTAIDYIEALENNNQLHGVNSGRNSFAKFFPGTSEEIFKLFTVRKNHVRKNHNHYFSDVIRSINSREEFAGIKTRGIRAIQRQRAIELLEIWEIVSTNKCIEEEQVKLILSLLGFNPLQVQVLRSSIHQQVDLRIKTEVIRDKESCPVALYGSNAEGSYKIICVWDHPTAEELLRSRVGETNEGEPVIVFSFGDRLSNNHRLVLAQLCQRYARTFIVVDDLLLIYLCGEPGERLHSLFNCTLPFTFIDPYTTTPGVVPPEIFYGRDTEKDSIAKRDGSCFIYGGRQLGKTALLRHVERTHHNPEAGRIVLYIDLKSQGIGYDKGVDEIWGLLCQKLYQLGVLKRPLSSIGGYTLLNQIETWLSDDISRSILLLLDEADRFLEADGTKEGQFIRASRIKRLMDDTKRRFKVVFAGLHNVQRMTSLSNHPLAHYGEPICIGPLLKGEDFREARSLIKKPLASIGYEIPDDLVTRILSRTNYYPSLAQLYCKELLKYVRDRGAESGDNGERNNISRWKITSAQVDEVYRSQGLRDAIRDRFMWTLQLDQRYEVIAYAIAHMLIGNQQNGDVTFSVEEIMTEVKYWWAEGFKGTNDSEIRVLLQEMVGLGVLREVWENSTKSFALRSSNLLLLMGTSDEIDDKLLEEREPELTYDPATFRPAFRNTLERRSPLTSQQESIIRGRENSVTMILGSSMAGLEQVQEYLQAKSDNGFFTYLSISSSKDEFVNELNKLTNRKEGGTTILLIPFGCHWTPEWIELALEKLKHFSSTDKFASVVFVADPQKAWDFLEEIQTFLSSISRNAKLFALKPWHDAALKQWLEDCDFATVTRQGRLKITEMTGNWHWLLNHFFDLTQNDRGEWEDAILKLSTQLSNPSEAVQFADLFGLSQEMDIHRKVLSVLADFLPSLLEHQQNGVGVMESDLVEYIQPELQVIEIERILKWAEWLNLAERDSLGKWSLDPIFRQVLDRLPRLP